MNKSELHQYYCQKFLEIPLEWFPKAQILFDENFSEGWKFEAISAIRQYGLNNWFNSEHFALGMWIRNKLRSAGMMDRDLPDNNWDDYYVPLLEWWLGFRTL